MRTRLQSTVSFYASPSCSHNLIVEGHSHLRQFALLRLVTGLQISRHFFRQSLVKQNHRFPVFTIEIAHFPPGTYAFIFASLFYWIIGWYIPSVIGLSDY